MNMLMRTDPFRELDRLTEQVFGTTTRPAVMPMDAWRHGDEFVVEFDVPGVKAEDVDLDVERNVLTIKAERPITETPGHRGTRRRAPPGRLQPATDPGGQPGHGPGERRI